MVRTDAGKIRDELDVTSDELSDSVASRDARRAHSLVENRLGSETSDVDDQLLEDIETLVGAHFAVGRVTGASTGEQVQRVSQESATVEFASGEDAAGSDYWDQAVMLDPTGKLAKRTTAPPIVGNAAGTRQRSGAEGSEDEL